jgi:hypothetical protein
LAEISSTELTNRYGNALQQDNAALFVGAGMSRTSGFVDWRGLMRTVADDLGLDIDQESDLIALAQYSFNKYQTRDRLNQLLIMEFTKDAQFTPNHRLIATLPIRTIWTTNYDTLIEDSMKAAHKRLDVKTTQENLATTLPDRDATLYKMHGDVSQPHEAVVTREDYEMYHDTREAFSIALKGDLLGKTFLFLGFSFSDPNIDYILSRIRSLLGRNQRSHYCILKKPEKPAGAADQARFEYEMRKLGLRVMDLGRYSIHTCLIDSYEDITRILQSLQRRAYLNDIFVSGSAQEYAPLGRDRVENLATTLGCEIVRRKYNLVSGLGLGLGASVTTGALRERYSTDERRGAVRFFPFPQVLPPGADKARLHTQFRRDMLANVGFSVFLCGNRLDSTANIVRVGKGVWEEFELTAALGRYPIPIGASGWAAREVWETVMSQPNKYYGTVNLTRELEILGDIGRGNSEYVEAIFNMVQKISG